MFAKGDKVVHPRHGAALIESLVELETDGERKVYFRLRLPQDLTIMIPLDTADEIGLRPVVCLDQIERLFALLGEEEGEMPAAWTQRRKQNLAKLMTGDIYQGAEVVRDLSHLGRRSSLSGGDQRMLDKARQNLISELTLTFDSTTERAEATLDSVLSPS